VTFIVPTIATVPFVLVVNNDLPVRTVPELIAFARERPGGLSYGSTGPGTPFHLYAELFTSMTGTRIKAAVAGLADLMGGRLQLMMTDFASSLPLIREHKVRALGVTTTTPASDILPIARSGVPGFEAAAWQMVVAPAATPKEVVEKLHGALKAVMAMPEARQQIARIGLVPVASGPPEELARFVTARKSPAGRRWSSDRARRWSKEDR
jgi:tripartite-type tricarboxylate transporter receptor subunit TctC